MHFEFMFRFGTSVFIAVRNMKNLSQIALTLFAIEFIKFVATTVVSNRNNISGGAIMLDPDRTCSSKQREPGESGIGRSAQSPDRCSWLSPKMNKSADPRLSQESRL